MMKRFTALLTLTLALLLFNATVAVPKPKSKSGIPTAKQIEARARTARPSKAEDGAIEIQGRFYTVRSYLEPELTAEISFFMDNFWGAFTSIFAKDRFKIKSKPIFIVYDGQQQFLDKNGMTSKGLLGFFRPSDRMLRAFVKNTDKGLYHFKNSLFRQVSQHEATHQLLYWLLGRMDIPFWFNEGSADFFGSWNAARPFDLNRNASFIDNIHINTVWEKMEKGELIDIRYFTSLESGGKFQSGPVIYHYGSSYAYISFMLSERTGFFTEYNKLWNDIKKGKSELYDEYFKEKRIKKFKIQKMFNKFLMEWRSYAHVRFLPPWQAPVAKLEFLATYLDEQIKVKGAYEEATREVITEYTGGMTFETGSEIKQWIDKNRDYLKYHSDEEVVVYENPGLDVDAFYYEYNNFALLNGLYGTLTLNQEAREMGISDRFWSQMTKSEKKKIDKLASTEVEEFLPTLSERWKQGADDRKETIKGLKEALDRLRSGGSR